MDTMMITWAVLTVVFFVVEGATAGLASIWFAAGSLVALAATFIGAPIWLQVVLFIVVSVVSLIITRPLAKKYVNKKIQPTNADKAIGMVAEVTERIDNIEGTGRASVGGRSWTARSANGAPIEAGTRAAVISIEGVKLMVQPISEPQTVGNSAAL